MSSKLLCFNKASCHHMCHLHRLLHPCKPPLCLLKIRHSMFPSSSRQPIMGFSTSFLSCVLFNSRTSKLISIIEKVLLRADGRFNRHAYHHIEEILRIWDFFKSMSRRCMKYQYSARCRCCRMKNEKETCKVRFCFNTHHTDPAWDTFLGLRELMIQVVAITPTVSLFFIGTSFNKGRGECEFAHNLDQIYDLASGVTRVGSLRIFDSEEVRLDDSTTLHHTNNILSGPMRAAFVKIYFEIPVYLRIRCLVKAMRCVDSPPSLETLSMALILERKMEADNSITHLYDLWHRHKLINRFIDKEEASFNTRCLNTGQRTKYRCNFIIDEESESGDDF